MGKAILYEHITVKYPLLNDGTYLTTSYVYDKLDRLTKITYPNSNTITYTYDLRGNRKTEEHSSDTTIIQPNMSNYTYDVRDRVTSVNKNNVITSMKYNADGLRYQKTIGSNTTQYHYDLDGQVIAEGEAGNIKANYVWDASHVMMKKDTSTGNQYFYLYNGHGDVVQIVDKSGNIVNNYDYDAWGNITTKTEGISNPFKYVGEVYDDETGTYYLRARYYDPTIGRFVTEDTEEGSVTNPLSLNLYSYCENDPIRYVDPTGHYTKDQALLYIRGAAVRVKDEGVALWNCLPALYQVGTELWTGDLSIQQLAAVGIIGITADYTYLINPENHAAQALTPLWSGATDAEVFYASYHQMGVTLDVLMCLTGTEAAKAGKAAMAEKVLSKSNSGTKILQDITKLEESAVVGGKITGYTKHGLAQAMGRDGGRGVAQKAIIEAVKNPIKTVPQDSGKIKYVGKDAVVVLNKNGQIVTTYAKGSNGLRGGK